MPKRVGFGRIVKVMCTIMELNAIKMYNNIIAVSACLNRLDFQQLQQDEAMTILVKLAPNSMARCL